MEKRKIQVSGNSTYVISLPKSWITRFGLKKGHSLGFHVLNDDTLVINPKINSVEETESNCIINIDNSDDSTIFRRYIGAYLAGNNIIEFHTEGNISRKDISSIRRMCGVTMGVETIDETSKEVIVRDLLGMGRFSITQASNRMSSLAADMLMDSIESINSEDCEFSKDIESRDNEVDKFYLMILKQFNFIVKDPKYADKMNVDRKKAFLILRYSRLIERIGDHSLKIINNADKLKKKEPFLKTVHATGKKLSCLFDETVNNYLNNDYEMESIRVKAKSLEKDTDHLSKELFKIDIEPSDAMALAMICDSLERIRSYIIDITYVSINYQIACIDRISLTEEP